MESPLLNKSAAFADRILDMSDYLLDGVEESEKSIVHSSSFIVQKKGSSSTRKPVRYSVEVCVKQVTRSGTSIAANVAEGQYAQSKDDLIATIHFSLFTLHLPTARLDRLLNRKVIDAKMHKSMVSNVKELISMLVASINTLKKNKEEQKRQKTEK